MKTVTSEAVARGQKIVTSFGRDNSSHQLPDTMGGKMGGSPTNISHSLSGASAVQRQSGKTKTGI